jgi:Mg-chelatase subunit ChlD
MNAITNVKSTGFVALTRALLLLWQSLITRVVDGIASALDANAAEKAPIRQGAPVAVLLIDASPSMDADDWKPSRLAAAKDAAKSYVNRIAAEQPDARIGIIAYSGQAEIVVDLAPTTATSSIGVAIDRITTSWCTNITAGLAAATQMLRWSSGPCQVVLLSDGFHNHGAKPLSTARKLRAKATVECVGIGGSPADVDAKLLKAISSTRTDGTPRYRWIGEKEQLVKEFEELAGWITKQ